METTLASVSDVELAIKGDVIAGIELGSGGVHLTLVSGRILIVTDEGQIALVTYPESLQ